jgi:hypothetical protein
VAPFAEGAPPRAAVDLLWLAPVVVVAATAFWTLSGPASSADAVLAQYVDLWRAGRTADAAALFAVAPDPVALGETWQRQSARLANETIRAAAVVGPAGAIDPAQPWESLRWDVEAGPNEDEGPDGTPAPGALPAVPGRTLVTASIVRRDTVRDSFLGLVPTTSQRLVPVATLGSVRLRTVELPGPFDGAPPVVAWRIDALDLLGERLGGG